MKLTDIKHFIVDGSWLARSRFAAGNLIDGTVAIISMFGQCGRVYVCWDADVKNHRKQLYPEYKANRKQKPDEYHATLPGLKRKLHDMGIWQFQPGSGEGDDAIYTMASQFKSDLDCAIVSADKDFLQCIKANICLVKIGRKLDYKIINERNVKKITGFDADEWLSIQILAGDSADNYPGIKGIGMQRAKQLISKYPHLVWDIIDGDGEFVLQNFRVCNPMLERYAALAVRDPEQLVMTSQLARLKHVKINPLRLKGV